MLVLSRVFPKVMEAWELKPILSIVFLEKGPETYFEHRFLNFMASPNERSLS